MEVLGEEDDEMEEYEDENILLDETGLEGDQGGAGNVMAVQVYKCYINSIIKSILQKWW